MDPNSDHHVTASKMNQNTEPTKHQRLDVICYNVSVLEMVNVLQFCVSLGTHIPMPGVWSTSLVIYQ